MVDKEESVMGKLVMLSIGSVGSLMVLSTLGVQTGIASVDLWVSNVMAML